MDLENIQDSRNLGGGGLVFKDFVCISKGPHSPSLTKQWRNCVSNLLHLLNCLTNTHKNHEIFPHFATLKIAFLVTFLYIFLHNHKDMVNLKNIFFFKNHFSNFIIEKNGNFEGCLIGAVKPLKINGRLKTFMFTNIQGV